MATFTRASKATYTNKQGVMAEAGIDEPRFEKEGILIEGTSTNLYNQSEDIDDGKDSQYYRVLAVDTGDTFGPMKLYSITDNGYGGYQFWRIAPKPTIAGMWTGSFFIKKLDNSTGSSKKIKVTASDITNENITFDFDSNGDLVLGAYPVDNLTISVTEFAGKLFRVAVTFKVAVGSTVSFGFHCDNTKGERVILSGLQLEELPFVSSYIPTNGTAVTRASDKVDIDGLKQTSSDNTLYAVISPIGAKSNYADIISGLMPSYRIEYSGPESGLISAYRDTIQAFIGSIVTYDHSLQDAWPVAVVSKGETFSTYANGSFVKSNSGTIPQGATGNVTLGREGAAFFHISDIRVWNHALTAEQIATL